tara:strand:+ start:5711 stop:6094 length:384 start_codon:yes stop_codon:yes gene_type:complete
MKVFKAAMVVVFNEKRDILLLKRFGDSNWMPYKWGIPGGHVEEGETPEQAAIRETFEETNLSLQNIFELEEKEEVMIYYSTSFDNGEELKIDYEHTDWAWVSYKKLDIYDTTPNLKHTVKLALDKMK